MITGNKRSIFDQTGAFGFNIDLSTDSYDKECNFGFSGDNIVNFRMLSGRIFDNNNLYCGSYIQNSLVNFSGQIGERSFDYFIDGSPIAIQKIKPTGKMSYFYVESQSGSNIQYDLTINGSLPNYSITENFVFLLPGLITGVITNNQPNLNFRFFSGASQSGNNFVFSGLTTGNISNQGSFYLIPSGGLSTGQNYTIPLSFWTNFGDFTLTFNATSSATGFIKTYLNPLNFSNFTGASGLSGQQQTLSYYTFSGLDSIPAPTIDIKLLYVSGYTGNIYSDVLATGWAGITPVSGIITGSGYLHNTISGNVTGLDGNGNLVYGSGQLDIIKFKYASGNFSQLFSVDSTGLGTGVYNATITGISSVTGTASGFITLSGFLNANISNIQATGYNVDPRDNISGNIANGIFSIPYFATGNFQKNFQDYVYGTGTGTATASVLLTGVYSGNVSGLITGRGFLIGGSYVTTGSGIFPGMTSSSLATGLLTGYIFKDKTASGVFSNNFIIEGLGTVTGFDPGLPGLNTGVGIGLFSGSYSGLITDIGGFLDIDNPNQTGIAQYGVVTYVSGYYNATGRLDYNIPLPNDNVSINGNTFTYLVDFFTFTGLFTAINDTFGGDPFSISSIGGNSIIFTATQSGSIGNVEFLVGQDNSGTMRALGLDNGLDVFISWTGKAVSNFTGELIDTLTGTGFFTGSVNSLIIGENNLATSGFFNCSGLGTGIASGTILPINSGVIEVFPILNQTPTTCSGISGISFTPFGNFIGSSDQFLTGSGFFTTTGAGNITGLMNPISGTFLSDGIVTGTNFVTILDGSGIYIISGLVSGNPISAFALITEGIQTSPITIFSGFQLDEIIGTGFYSSTTFGFFTGILTGVFDYIKTFTGTWDLQTGYSEIGLVSFQSGHNFNVTGFYNPSGAIMNTSNDIIIQVNDFIRKDYNPMVVRLLVEAYNSSIDTLITGQRI